MIPNLSRLSLLARRVAADYDSDEEVAQYYPSSPPYNPTSPTPVMPPLPPVAPALPTENDSYQTWFQYVVYKRSLDMVPLTLLNRWPFNRVKNMIAAIPDAFETLDERWRNDLSIMKGFLAYTPGPSVEAGRFALHAGPRVLKNREFVQTAMQYLFGFPTLQAQLFAKLDRSLQYNVQFVTELIKNGYVHGPHYMHAANFLTEEQRSDKPFLTQLFRGVKRTDSEYGYTASQWVTLLTGEISPDLRSDRDFLIGLIRNKLPLRNLNRVMAQSLDSPLWSDGEFMLELLEIIDPPTPTADRDTARILNDNVEVWWEFLGVELQQDREFLLRVAAQSVAMTLHIANTQRVAQDPLVSPSFSYDLIKTTLEANGMRLEQVYKMWKNVTSAMVEAAVKQNGEALNMAASWARLDHDMILLAARTSAKFAMVALYNLHEKLRRRQQSYHDGEFSAERLAEVKKMLADEATEVAKHWSGPHPDVAPVILQTIELLAEELVAPLYAPDVELTEDKKREFEEDMQEAVHLVAKRMRMTQAALKMAADVHAAHVGGAGPMEPAEVSENL